MPPWPGLAYELQRISARKGCPRIIKVAGNTRVCGCRSSPPREPAASSWRSPAWRSPARWPARRAARRRTASSSSVISKAPPPSLTDAGCGSGTAVCRAAGLRISCPLAARRRPCVDESPSPGRPRPLPDGRLQHAAPARRHAPGVRREGLRRRRVRRELRCLRHGAACQSGKCLAPPAPTASRTATRPTWTAAAVALRGCWKACGQPADCLTGVCDQDVWRLPELHRRHQEPGREPTGLWGALPRLRLGQGA